MDKHTVSIPQKSPLRMLNHLYQSGLLSEADYKLWYQVYRAQKEEQKKARKQKHKQQYKHTKLYKLL